MKHPVLQSLGRGGIGSIKSTSALSCKCSFLVWQDLSSAISLGLVSFFISVSGESSGCDTVVALRSALPN